VPGHPEDMLDLHSHSQFGMSLGLPGLIQQANSEYMKPSSARKSRACGTIAFTAAYCAA